MLQPQDIDRFLADHWQKKPLYLAAALDNRLPQISPDELAWLAMQPDVESRLVFTDRDAKGIRYRVEHGPFDEAVLGALPDRDWTLLVQDVEKHLPDFRAYLGKVSFVPDWRIDDLMVSCAAPGGSVGPHVDNYDVFLCQGLGARDWRIGRAGQFEVATDSHGLALVRPFPEDGSHRAVGGDVLYLPPGVPHWGIAVDLCTTYSIGFRAPTRRELELGQERVLGETVVAIGTGSEETFYTDPDLSSPESLPGCIDMAAIRRLREQRLLADSLDDDDLARVFGCVVTDPKAWLAPEAVAGDRATELLEKPPGLGIHGMARIAWIENGEFRRVFVNGVDRQIDSAQLRLVRQLCAERLSASPSNATVGALKANRDLVDWLARAGLFDDSLGKE